MWLLLCWVDVTKKYMCLSILCWFLCSQYLHCRPSHQVILVIHGFYSMWGCYLTYKWFYSSTFPWWFYWTSGMSLDTAQVVLQHSAFASDILLLFDVIFFTFFMLVYFQGNPHSLANNSDTLHLQFFMYIEYFVAGSFITTIIKGFIVHYL